MAIGKKESAAVTSGTTHNGNGTDVKVEQGDAKLANHQESMTLTDPNDLEGGSTYSNTPVKASTVLAGLEDLNEPATEEVDEDDELDEDFDGEDEDEVVAEFGDEDEVVAPGAADEDIADGADGGMGDETDWDAPPADDDSDIVGDMSDEDEMQDEEVVEAEEVVEPSGDMSLLDVDGTDDNDMNGVAFASFGTRLMVIKSNRIIATMQKSTAALTNKQDIYLTDQFQQVVASELNKVGLRMGLKNMGFALAKVNVASQEVINARVKKEVTRTTAAVRQVTASKEKAFQQSLAIAAIGMSRNFFKDTPNQLKASLEAELLAAGVRNPGRILAACFNKAGPAYAHSLVTLANKISAMSEEVRDNYATAFDMTSDEPEDMPEDEDQSMVFGEDSFDEDFVEEDTPVVASLASPGVAARRSTAVKAASNHSGVSVTARAILDGKAPLF